jgi:hypothetical protein
MYTLGDVSIPDPAAGGSMWSSFATGLKDLAPVLTQAYRERMILKAQLARAQAGLPAFDATHYSPPMRVETTVGASADLKRTLLMVGAAGAALGALYLIFGRPGRRN